MDSFPHQQQQSRRLIAPPPISGDQHQGPPFWYPSSSPPPPPGPGPYPPQPSYSHHPPPYPQPHQWQQPPPAPPPPMAMLPHLPPYNSNQPQIPPPSSYPPPPPSRLHQYSIPPPRPHQLLPPPHQHQPPLPPSAFPPPGQAWGNPSWAQQQGWEYSDRNIPFNNEEDWAARAKAWASSNFVTENHHTQTHFTETGRMNEHSYGYHDQYQQAAVDPTDIQHSSFPQSNSQQLPTSLSDSQRQVNNFHGSTPFSSSSSYGTDGRMSYNAGDEAMSTDRDHMASPQKSYALSSSIYEQEVPYSYSSAPGNREVVGQSESSLLPPPLLVSSVQEGHQSQSTLPAQNISAERPHFVHGGQSTKFLSETMVQPVDFEARHISDHEPHQKNSYGHAGPAGPVGVMDHDPAAGSINAWTQVPLGQSGPQFDHSFTPQASLPVHSTSVFVRNPALSFRPSIPPVSAPFSLGPGATLHAAAFPGDVNGNFSVSERPRKAPVPNWLREEIIKVKPVIPNTAPTHTSVDSFNATASVDVDKSFRRADQDDSKNVDSPRSTEDEEDDEDDVEAARSAAINQEIKRVLTEVLLKVTDELFDEIATKVLNEDERTVEVEETSVPGKLKVSPPPAIPTPKASAKVLVSAKPDSNKAEIVGENSRPSSPGDVLGLGNYGSDASDDEEETQSSKLLLSRKMVGSPHQQEINDSLAKSAPKEKEKRSALRSIEATRQDMEIERKVSMDAALHNHCPSLGEKNHIANNGSAATNNLYFHKKQPERVSETSEKTVSVESRKVHDYPLENSNALQQKEATDGKDSRKHESTSGHANNVKSIAVDSHAREFKRNLGANRSPERSEGKDFNKDRKAGLDKTGSEAANANDPGMHEDKSKLKEKMDRMDHRSKLKERADDASAKRSVTLRELDTRKSSKQDNVKDDRRESTKDKREKNKDINESKSERTSDQKDDRPPGVTKDSSRYGSRRSISPSPRGRSSKDYSFSRRGSASSDEPSDNSKKRKLQSSKRSFSPSPTMSRKRQVSRSPPSKHSHRRHSPYTSQDRSRRRSRSGSPIHQRRSAAHK